MAKGLWMVMLSLVLPVMAQAAPPSPVAPAPSSEVSAERVMQHYAAQQDEVSPQRKISLRSKHEVLFWMGAALLLFLLLSAFFGVGTGVLGKDWFIPHMICAGITVTLGIAHAVTAFVWFYPY